LLLQNTLFRLLNFFFCNFRMNPPPERPRGMSYPYEFKCLISQLKSTKTQEFINEYTKDSAKLPSENVAEYKYTDAEDLLTELCELYSYGEESTYKSNSEAFEAVIKKLGLPRSWKLLSDAEKMSILMSLANDLDHRNVRVRMRASEGILYIAQGCWADLVDTEEHAESIGFNGILLYHFGIFTSFVDLLKIEVANFHNKKELSENNSRNLRIILNVLYTITEVIRKEKNNVCSEYTHHVESFCTEVLFNEESLITILFDMLIRFCDCHTYSYHFPLKKVLLLLWKLLLIALGGLSELEETKKEIRMDNGLPPEHDSSEEQQPDPNRFLDVINLIDLIGESSQRGRVKKRPKVRQEEHNKFLRNARLRFEDSNVKDDDTDVVGLPAPICSSIEIIKKHIYTPLGQRHVEREKLVRSDPDTHPDEIELTPAELVYEMLFPNFNEYMVSLLKVILWCGKFRTERLFSGRPPISGLAPEADTNSRILYSVVLYIDLFRHNEIILKSVSAILLLLLKHLKLNNVYQFEYMSQCLVTNNVLTILMAFFKQNIAGFVTTLNEIPALNFTECVTGTSEIKADCLNQVCTSTVSSRNMFFCINFLRVLNKLVKWKPARIEHLESFRNSKAILNRLVEIKHDTIKLYALKLLKMQMKYTRKNWRKRHVHLINEIYNRVRLHMNDSFLTYVPPKMTRDKLEDHKDENLLRKDIAEFNERRYGDLEKQQHIDIDFCTRKVVETQWLLPYCLNRAHHELLTQEFLC
jgi:hypothetical protein